MINLLSILTVKKGCPPFVNHHLVTLLARGGHFSVSQSTIRGEEEEKDEEGVKFMRRPKRHIFFLISELTVKLVELILKADVQCEPYDQ